MPDSIKHPRDLPVSGRRLIPDMESWRPVGHIHDNKYSSYNKFVGQNQPNLLHRIQVKVYDSSEVEWFIRVQAFIDRTIKCQELQERKIQSASFQVT
jgi:hypothetical protein